MTDVAEQERSIPIDHEHPTLLQRIALQASGLMAGEVCSNVVPNGSRLQKGENAAAKAGQIEGPPLRVPKNRDIGDVQVLLKGPCRGGIAGPDNHHIATRLADGRK